MKTLEVLFTFALLVPMAAEAGESPWTLRFHGAVVQSSGSHYSITTNDTTFRVGSSSSGGFGVGAEYRFSNRVGLEVSTLFAALEIGADASARNSSLERSLELSMMPLMVSVPFHFSAGRKADIFVAPLVGHVTYHNARTSLGSWMASSSVDIGSDTAFGAAVGVDVDFGNRDSWAFSTGLRYMKANAGGTDVDPKIATVGFAYRF